MRVIKEKMNEERKKSMILLDLAIDEKIPFKKSQEMRKEQKEHYNKFQFFKKLNEAMEGKNDNK